MAGKAEGGHGQVNMVINKEGTYIVVKEDMDIWTKIGIFIILGLNVLMMIIYFHTIQCFAGFFAWFLLDQVRGFVKRFSLVAAEFYSWLHNGRLIK